MSSPTNIRVQSSSPSSLARLRAAVVALLSIVATPHCAGIAGSRIGDADDLSSLVETVPRSREVRVIRDALIEEKLRMSLPPAMHSAGVNMWILLDRENLADPLHAEVGGGYSGAVAARVFAGKADGTIEKMFFGSHEQPADSVVARTFDRKEFFGNDLKRLQERLGDVVRQYNPSRIAINSSTDWASADGLTTGLRAFLVAALGIEYAQRFVSAERLAREYRGRRTPLETKWYRVLQQWTSDWETRALLAGVKPGTTVFDLVSRLADDAMLRRLTLVEDHGRFPMIVWFADQAAMPGLSAFNPRHIGRAGAREVPIEPGDVITLDGGLRFLHFASDMKRTAYVRRTGETGPPPSITAAWRNSLEVARIYARTLMAGATLQQIWPKLVAELEAKGFAVIGADRKSESEDRPRVGLYGHAVGNVVHDVGIRVSPEGLLGTAAAWPLLNGEWISVEFHVESTSPDSRAGNSRWYTRFEQTGRVTPRGLEFLVPLQEEMMVIETRPR